MTNDEVEKLASKCEAQSGQHHDAGPLGWRNTLCEAADALRRLRDERDQARAELEKAREALEPFAKAWPAYDKSYYEAEETIDADEQNIIQVGHLRIAARVHAETGEK